MRCETATSVVSASSAEKSSSPIASSISLRWSSRSSTLPVTFAVAASVELGHLGADLLERADRLGLDLLARLLEPALPVGLGLLAGALALRVGDLARLGEDLPRLALRLADQLLVLLEQPARLGARVLGLLDRGADALAALVDRLLDRAERELPQHEEGDREADERPDHQTRDDVDQR